MGEMRREVEIVQNAWKKTGYEWFVNEDGGEWVVCVCVSYPPVTAVVF